MRDIFYSLGISIDSDYIRICILDCEGNILKESSEKLEDRLYEPRKVINKSKKLYDKLCEEDQSLDSKVKVVGVSCTGNISHITGDVYFAAQMEWNERFNLKTLIDQLVKVNSFLVKN